MNKTALVTGPTSGIGYAIAKNLSKKTFDLVLVGRNKEKLEKTAHELKSDSIEIHTIKSDLGLQGSADHVFSECKKLKVDIDVLINNAGTGYFGETVESDPGETGTTLILNILTLTQLCILFGNEMKKRSSGKILNIASTSAYQPVPYMAVYAASKSYVLNLSEALAKELEEYNVSVTCVSPGMTDTDWFHKAGISDSNKGFFSKKKRVSAESTAQFALEALFKNKLSSIHGALNRVMSFSPRLLPRKTVAKFSKNMLYEAFKKNAE